MVNPDRVLDVLIRKGPLLPVQIVKELGGTSKTNTFFVGAILSQLSSSNKVIISNLKVGGSPLYYVKGQESKLQDYERYLHEKELRIYNLLKDKKILRDKDLSPVERVGLRNIKDFAKPLEVSLKGTEIFWKWYLLANTEAESIIKGMLNLGSEQSTPEPAKEIQKPIQTEIKSNQEKTNSDQKSDDLISNHINGNSEKEVKEEIKKPVEPTVDETTKKEEPKAEEKKEISSSNNSKLSDDSTSSNSDNSETKSNKSQSFLKYDEETTDKLVKKVKEFFSKREITILNTNVIKANEEVDFIIKVPSAIGTLNFYCSAKDKKKCSDSDLAFAYIKAEKLSLPLLYLSTGEIVKKGIELLETDLKTVSFKQI